ncbi:GmrSD restriction endonuclease domain-containing protein [Umezawaea tangerina]|uniref:GmrSD restriction endonucleases N-terminal domain-containing protein n=1 Tax=Umezawaea tangerina TaxID=84725 RepID=A0A2T0TJG4_9PSEU|nr:DUF262 domain-containing protein [Umezawaea tangerina]PRY45765.1 hypothetical protein CLV43_10125 [Umezawaea tangerina]
MRVSLADPHGHTFGSSGVIHLATEKPAFRDPKPTVERVTLLARRVLEGDILLPKFQREFVWSRKQIRDLLDSVASNYPIGSVLLWQSRTELASERTIAGLQIAARKDDYPVNYLLDGQQRLSTICGALYWKPNDDPDSMWNIVYDLKTGDFVHKTTLDDPPLNEIPFRLLSNPSTFFKRMSVIDDGELKERADTLFNRIQDYMIAAVTLGDMSIDQVAPVFERINSTGTPLTVVDLMRAATWKMDFDLKESIDEVLAVLEGKKFGKIDRKTVLRTIAAAAGYGFSTENIDRLREKNSAELKQCVSDAEKAARKAVDFLVTQIGIPGAQALPYMNQFAVLVEIFRSTKTLSSDQHESIKRWFWQTTFSGYFGGWNTGQMGADKVAIQDFAEGRSEHVNVTAPMPSRDVWRLKQFRANNAISKMEAIMLSYAAPLDLRTGQKIDVGKALAWGNDKEFHHFFPRAYLTKRKNLSAGRANVMANIVMITSESNIWISDRPPSDYLKDLCEAEGELEIIRRLETCLVPRSAFNAAMADDYEGFLIARSALLHECALKLAHGKPSASGEATRTELDAPDGSDPVIDDPEPVDRDSAD